MRVFSGTLSFMPFRGDRRWARPKQPRRRSYWRPQPCHICGAADARDADHQAGCPHMPELPRAELVARARAIEAGWEEKSAAAGRTESRGAAA